MVALCCSHTLAAIALAGLITYSWQALHGLRHTPRLQSYTFIDKLAVNGLLRYRGTRGGRLTRVFREQRRKDNLQVRIGRSAAVIKTHVPCVAIRSSTASATSPPTLYVLNARSIAKPHAKEQLTGKLIGYDVDIAIISEMMH